MTQLLSDFIDCFESTPTSTTPLVKQHIDTGDAKLIASSPHRALAAENNTINGFLEDMLQQEIIGLSCSPWPSPVVLAPKSDGSVRFCVDY
jgi:hypothetical protein